MSKQISSTKTNSTLNHSILNRTFFSFLLLFSITLTTQSFFSDSNLLNSNLQVLGEQTQNPPNLPLQQGGQALEKGGATDQFQSTPTTNNLPLSQRGIKGVLAQCRHCITGKNIKDSAISSNKIKNKSLLSEDIASNQINSRTIEDLSIQEEDLSNSLQDTINQAPLFSRWNKSSGIEIQESQIIDLQNYLTTETDPIFSAWNKSTGITITESQISNLQSYLTTISGLNISLLNNNSNYITDGNTNWNNEYNFITASTSDTLTNKSGNISMWTNDSSYITDGNTNWNNEYSFITNLSSFTTDNLTQGTTNKYTQWTTNGSTISYSNNVGIGTTTPTEKLEVAGNIKSSNYIGSGNRCVYVDLNGVLRVKSEDCGTSSGGDNLGNHTLTQNIIMGNNWISGDGDNEGFQISSTGILSGAQGNISMWTNDSNYITDGNTNWNNEYSFITASTTDTLTNKSGNISMWTNNTGYLTSYTETDPAFSAWNKSTGITITESQISNLQSYLTSYTETDPIFLAHQANNITASHLTILGNTSNTNTGDETTSSIKTKLGTSSTSTDGYLTSTDWNIFNNKQPAGSYLTSYTETDPIYTAWNKSTGISITESQISNLQSYITDGNTNWNNSYGFITDLSTFTTDNLTQGTTNLYSQWATSGANISFAGGNVGIGTTSPGANLEVNGTVQFDNTVSLFGSAANLYLGSSSGSGQYGALYWDDISKATNIVGTQGQGTVMTWKNGNVGIGTTAPGYKLTVQGTNGMDAVTVLNSSGYPAVALRPNTAGLISLYDGASSPTEKVAIRADSSPTFFNGGGNLGIGTTGPGAKLDVRGGVYINNNLGVGTAVSAIHGIRASLSLTNQNGLIGIEALGYHNTTSTGTYYNFGFSSSGRDSISSGQNNAGYIMGADISGYAVGPGSISTVYGTRIDTGTLTTAGTISYTYGASIRLLNQASGVMANSYGVHISSSAYSGTMTNVYGVYLEDMAGTNDYGIYQAGANDTNYFAGNLGIGTTAPQAKLDLGNTGGDKLYVYYNGGDMYGLGINGSGHYNIFAGNGANTYFKTGGSSGTTIMSLLTSGNVGIGTVSPAGKIDIKTPYETSKWALIINQSSYAPLTATAHDEVLIQRDDVASMKIYDVGDGGLVSLAAGDGDSDLASVGPLKFWTGGSISGQPYAGLGGTLAMTITGGYVGINTTSPSYYLHINGSAYSTGGWSSSDQRWKNNINTLNNNTLEKVLSLNPVTYEWDLTNYPNQGFQTGTQFGFIAQQVEPIFPELVHTDNTGYKSLSYEKFTPILTKAVQELNLKKADLTLLTTNQQSIDQNFNLISNRITEIEEWITVFTRMTSDIDTIETNLSQLTIDTQEQYNALSFMLTDHEQRIQNLESLISGINITQPELSTQMQELDFHLQATSNTDGYLFDLDGNLKVKKMEAEEIKTDEIKMEGQIEKPECGLENEGNIYYDKNDKHFYGCNGIIWEELNSASSTDTPEVP